MFYIWIGKFWKVVESVREVEERHDRNTVEINSAALREIGWK